MKKVGVLALQGDFAAHEAALARAGAEPVEVREAEQFRSIDGLIIPGGESTTMLKLLRYEGLLEPLTEFGRRKPIFGTCAGAILLAKEVSNPVQESLGLMDLSIERNAYGRQVDSRVAQIDPTPDLAAELAAERAPDKLEGVFIRAPIIRRAGPGVRVLAIYAGDPVLVEEGRHLAATYHPELTSDARVHRLFVGKL
jgi:5'-phosphate synthase pdxT subunit